jgi:hypothetical protein
VLEGCRKVGFRLSAGIRSGAIPYSDREVDASSDLSKLIPVWIDESDDEVTCYYENLNNFISWNVLEFIHEHEYSDTYGNSLPYLQQDSRYVQALEYYQNCVAHFKSGNNNEGYS